MLLGGMVESGRRGVRPEIQEGSAFLFDKVFPEPGIECLNFRIRGAAGPVGLKVVSAPPAGDEKRFLGIRFPQKGAQLHQIVRRIPHRKGNRDDGD